MNTSKEICIIHWVPVRSQYVNGQTMPYTKAKRDEIIDDILEEGFSVMIFNRAEFCRIYIDTMRFQQR